jgi:hypothetical protein
MRGHVRRRGEPGSWEYIVDVGPAAAQRCQSCSRRLWIERRPKESRPECDGKLAESSQVASDANRQLSTRAGQLQLHVRLPKGPRERLDVGLGVACVLMEDAADCYNVVALANRR